MINYISAYTNNIKKTFGPYLLDFIDINLKVKVVIYDKLWYPAETSIIIGSDIILMANQENIIFLS